MLLVLLALCELAVGSPMKDPADLDGSLSQLATRLHELSEVETKSQRKDSADWDAVAEASLLSHVAKVEGRDLADQPKSRAPPSVDETVAVESACSPQGEVVFVLGGPGSGKGTQCSMLTDKFTFKHFSGGDLLRAEVDSGSDQGRRINETMKKGELVDASIIIGLLTKAVNSAPGPYLIDGFPRSEDNLKLWDQQCGQCAMTLFYNVTEDQMMKRLLKRSETSGRADDNEKTIRERFKTFETQSMPVIKELMEHKLVGTIDASGTPDEVFDLTVQALQAHQITLTPRVAMESASGLAAGW